MCMWIYCMCIAQIPHLFHRQIWRWFCFWASSPLVQMAVAFDWLIEDPWLLLLGCSSWQGGRGACPHTLRCHTSTHTCTCRVEVRCTHWNESKKYSKTVARWFDGSPLPVLFHSATESMMVAQSTYRGTSANHVKFRLHYKVKDTMTN